MLFSIVASLLNNLWISCNRNYGVNCEILTILSWKHDLWFFLWFSLEIFFRNKNIVKYQIAFMSAIKCLINTLDLFKSIPLQFFNIVVKFRLLRVLIYHSSFYLHMTPFFIWNLRIKGTTHVISNDTSCSIHNGAQLKALSDEECMINPSYYDISDYNWLILNGVFYKVNYDNFCSRYNGHLCE